MRRSERLAWFLVGALTFALTGFAVKWWDDDDVVYHTASSNEPLPVFVYGGGP